MGDQNLVGSMSALALGDNPPKSYRKQLEDKAIAVLLEAGGEVGDAVMPKKIRGDLKHAGNVEKLTTNLFGMTMDDKVSVFRYDVKIKAFKRRKDGTEVEVVWSEKHNKDAFHIEHRDRCREVYNALYYSEGSILAKARSVYYDLESILFSLDDLKITKNAEFDVPPVSEEFVRSSVYLSIVQRDPVICLSDMIGLSLELDEVHGILTQFLDIATGQYAMLYREEHVSFTAGRSFLMSPDQYGFRPEDTVSFAGDAAYLAIGVDKAVRFIEGPANRTNACSPALIVQAKKTPFHNVCPLAEKAALLVPQLQNIREEDRAKLEKYLKGLVVQTGHGSRRQVFVIDGIGPSARSMKIAVKGKEISVEEYFQENYHGLLKQPLYPLVVTGRNEQYKRYFPMELCEVCDNQRVKTHQLSAQMTQQIIRQCAIAPGILREQNQKVANSLHLWDSEFLQSANISVVNRPTEVDAQVIPTPKILFGNNAQTEVQNFSWRGQRYLNPALFDKWAAVAFLGDRDIKKLNMNTFRDFVKRFTDEAHSKGVQIADPLYIRVEASSTESINKMFEKMQGDQILYVLAIHADDAFGDIPHADIKYAERQFSLVSQCVQLKTLLNVVQKNQRVTTQNIVNKSNVKYGGLNYSLSGPSSKTVLEENTLYIGFGTNHPGGGLGFSTPSNSPPSSEGAEHSGSGSPGKSDSSPKEDRRPPTVVGYAANLGQNGSFDFVGDFVYQEPLRDEKIEVISEIVQNCVMAFHLRRNYYPKRIILYRGGCSDGQFKLILKCEIPLMKVALQKLKCDSKITVLAVNKLQSVRFFKKNIPRGKIPEQNVQPGTVVDRTLTHPLFAEFFLNSHCTLQGTARVPKYTVLYDDNQFDMVHLEEMTYMLCYGHQIVYMPTSLPSPVYIANCYADRGRTLYQRWIAQGGEFLDYAQLTKTLQFASAESFTDDLYGFRVNA